MMEAREVRSPGGAGPAGPPGPAHSARGRLSRSLGNAASSIVANTPRGLPSSGLDTSRARGASGGSISGGQSAMPAKPGSSHSTARATIADPDGGGPNKYVGLMSDFDISMMNGNEATKQWAAPHKSASSVTGAARPRTTSEAEGTKSSPRASVGSGSHSDSGDSDASTMSIRELRRTLTGSNKGDIKGEATSARLNCSDCSVEIDKEPSCGKWRACILHDFRQLCADGRHREGLLQALEMYGFNMPNKLQQCLVPVVLHFVGKYLEGRPDPAGPLKSCVLIQGPSIGKTSSVILGCLSVIDSSLQRPQAIFVSRSPRQDINKFLRVFALTHALTFQAFDPDETGLDLEIDEASPEAVAARTAQVLVGHPGRIRKLLSLGTIALDAIKAFVVDDAHLFLNGSAPEAAAPTEMPSQLTLSGLPSGDKRAAVEASASNKPAPADNSSSSPRAVSTFVSSAIEDVVEICKLLDVHTTKIPYFILAEEQAADRAAKKMMKMLKSSMVTRKNLLSVENCTLPTKLIKGMKHYSAEAKSTDWVRVFTGLVQALTFPRALIYCDDESIHHYLHQMQAMGIAVSANLPGATSESRQRALQDFSSNKTQFLLTHSEPAVCQVMLPKVSCVFHFGIMSQMPSVYGVRLCPLDEKLKKESASILLVEAPKASKNKEKENKEKDDKDAKGPDAHPIVSKLQKSFGITFMDMPLELLPAGPSGGRSAAQANKK